MGQGRQRAQHQVCLTKYASVLYWPDAGLHGALTHRLLLGPIRRAGSDRGHGPEPLVHGRSRRQRSPSYSFSRPDSDYTGKEANRRGVPSPPSMRILRCSLMVFFWDFRQSSLHVHKSMYVQRSTTHTFMQGKPLLASPSRHWLDARERGRWLKC